MLRVIHTAFFRLTYVIIALECLLPLLIVACFIFEDHVTRLMYAWGFNENIVSHFWFLRDQYKFLSESGRADQSIVKDFHVYELVVWASIVLFSARLFTGVFVPEWFSRNPHRDVASSGSFLLGTLVLSLVALWATTKANATGGVPHFEFLLQHSHRAFFCVETIVFFTATLFLVEWLLVVTWLMLGV